MSLELTEIDNGQTFMVIERNNPCFSVSKLRGVGSQQLSAGQPFLGNFPDAPRLHRVMCGRISTIENPGLAGLDVGTAGANYNWHLGLAGFDIWILEGPSTRYPGSRTI